MENIANAEVGNQPSRKGSVKRHLLLLVLFSLPWVITILVSLIYRGMYRWFRVKWYVPVLVLCLDTLVVAVQPIAAAMSGPLYVWYHALDAAHQSVFPQWEQFTHQYLHQPLNLMDADKPVFYHVNVHGNPLSSYFSLPQAVVSSLLWAITLMNLKYLFYRRKSRQEVDGESIGEGSSHSMSSAPVGQME